MNNPEIKDQTEGLSTNATPEMSESSDRRSFIKSTIIAASAVAAGGLAVSATHAGAQDQKVSDEPTGSGIFPRDPVGIMQIHFDPSTQPTLSDIQSVLAQIFRRTGCPTCGLAGVDIRLGLDPIVRVDSARLVNVILEGILPG